MGTGWGWLPLLSVQVRAESRFWVFLPRRGGGRARLFPAAVPGAGLPLLIPSGAQGTLRAAFSPSSCPQPIPGVAAAIVDVAELQDSLSEPPEPTPAHIAPGLSLPSRTLQPPRPRSPPFPPRGFWGESFPSSPHVGLAAPEPPVSIWEVWWEFFLCFPSIFFWLFFTRSGWQLPSPCLPWVPPWQPPQN